MTKTNKYSIFNCGDLKCTLCQGHYDFSFSDFYFIFVCCVEASKWCLWLIVFTFCFRDYQWINSCCQILIIDRLRYVCQIINDYEYLWCRTKYHKYIISTLRNSILVFLFFSITIKASTGITFWALPKPGLWNKFIIPW